MSLYEKKILITDDDPSILKLIEIILKKEGYKNILKAKNGMEAVKICETDMPDVIILDVMMPDIDGYEVCKKIREKSMVPVLFLSAKSDESDKLISYAIGGDEYITKPFSTKELAAKVKAVLKRQEYYNFSENKEKSEGFSFGEFYLNKNKKILQKDKKYIPLTAKEYALLEFMVDNKGITLSKEQILGKVWGVDFYGYDNTVMVHIRHLREKIECDPAHPEYIKTIKGRGYLFDI